MEYKRWSDRRWMDVAIQARDSLSSASGYKTYSTDSFLPKWDKMGNLTGHYRETKTSAKGVCSKMLIMYIWIAG